MFWLTLLAFLIILGLLVFFHELGHFVAAKSAGVKVEEFAFGFPPHLYCYKKGETKYCINLIPFGGYVKMLGEDRAAKAKDSFSQKKVRFRFIIVVAGVIMNFILAGLLLSIGYMVGMPPIRLDPAKLGGTQTNQVFVAQVLPDSPAQAAGLEAGDIVYGFKNTDEFRDFTKSKMGEAVNFTINRKGETMTKTATISEDPNAPLGVAVADLSSVKLSFFKAIYYGFKDAILTTGYIVVLLKDFVVNSFKTRQLAGEVAGPVGIFTITGQAVKMGFSYLIQLAALLSINLGLINIMPFPALDGGRAVLILSEGIFRRKIIKEEIEGILHMIGYGLLLLLIFAITYREVANLIKAH